MKSHLKIIVPFLLIGTILVSSCSTNNIRTSQQSTNTDTVEPTTTPDEGKTSSSSVDETFTVTWRVEGTVVEVDENVKKGEMPVYDGETPTKENTDEFHYTFNGWNPELKPVESDQTYDAVFNEAVNEYIVTFNSNGGTNIDSVTVLYGCLINEPDVKPEKEGYKFVNWCTDKELTTPVEWPYLVKKDVTFYAAYNVKVDLVKHLKALFEGYSLNPMSYITESLLPSYSANLVEESELNYDFATFVQTKDILDYGYGEQWMMVLENLNQSMLFFNVLSVVDTLSASSITAFNNYMDKNPGETANHSFKLGDYNVTIDFDGLIMSYVLEFETTIPVIGSVTAQLALTLDVNSGERTGRIQLSDANALKYVMKDNSYQFAIRYGGFRRAYFEINKDVQGNTNGSIFEYLSIDGKVETSSSAQFFIKEDYTTVVGNKADGIIGFKGAICELYNTSNGHLLGYEVNELLDAAGVEINYDTLWFNLSDTTGINSVKEIVNQPVEEGKENPNGIYINGSINKFETKKYGGFGPKMLSRRFDIEMRKRYFSHVEGDSVVTKQYLIPMLFVQEEKLNDLIEDINKTNEGLNFDLIINESVLSKLQNEYDSRLPVFNEAKDDMSVEAILSFIGTRVEF